jgi:hypothetical protein
MAKKERKKGRKKQTNKGRKDRRRTSREVVAAMEVEELQESRRKNQGRISVQQEEGT